MIHVLGIFQIIIIVIDNTVVTNTQDHADVKCYTKPLIDIFTDICKGKHKTKIIKYLRLF